MKMEHLLRLDSIIGAVSIILLRPASIILGIVLRRDHEMVVRNQLVVTKIKGGGSLLLALPALLALRKKYPEQKFTLVTSKEVRPFAEMMHVFDEIVLVDLSNLWTLVRTSLIAIKRVWGADALINLEIHSRMLTVFSCLTCARNRIGFYHQPNSWQRDVITHLFFFNITSPLYENYNQVAVSMGAEIPDYGSVADFFVKMNGLMRKKSPNETPQNVCIAPFCSDLGKEREFDMPDWIKILQHKYGNSTLKLTLLGSPGDIKRAYHFEKALSSAFPQSVINNKTGNTSLREAAEIISESDEFLSVDSGLNHLARLMGGQLRIFSYWGPTEPGSRLAPFPDCKETVYYKKLFCSPCVHVVQTPPCKGDNICMKQHAEQKINPYASGGWLIISDSAKPRKL
jgi:ADP-heptose:LPS heptosyltransferase